MRFSRLRYQLITVFALLALSLVPVGAVPVPKNIKDAVTYIYVPSKDGKQVVENGTGFFVYVENEQSKRDSVYLVTAKHVLLEKPGKFYSEISIRINNSEGTSDFIKIPLAGPNAAKLFTHSDSTVDVAVIPGSDIKLLPGKAKNYWAFKAVSISMAISAEHFEKGHVQEGDETFFVGLFSHYSGTKKNYPIVRFGRLAMITNEKIPWDDQMLTLYLVETQSFGGNSGSPVFFYPSLEREPGRFVLGRPTLLFAGVMMGTFQGAHEIRFAKPGKPPERGTIQGRSLISVENIGIAAVVPASQVKDILFSDAVKAHRAASIK